MTIQEDWPYTDSRIWLQEEYNLRRAKNHSFSVRAFARLLEIPPGRLSELLSSKRNLTVKLGKKISDKLSYSPQKEELFLTIIERERSWKKAQSDKGMLPGQRIDEEEQNYIQLSKDQFHVLADWYYFALLNLITTENFKNDPSWIARRLGISVVEVRSALDRLLRLGLIEKDEERGLKRTVKNLTTTHDVESRALKISHKQTLMQSVAALEEVPVEFRDISSITMAINSSKIPEAKILIREFRRRMASLMGEGNKDEVYNLNVQLVPLTQIEAKGNSQELNDDVH